MVNFLTNFTTAQESIHPLTGKRDHLISIHSIPCQTKLKIVSIFSSMLLRLGMERLLIILIHFFYMFYLWILYFRSDRSIGGGGMVVHKISINFVDTPTIPTSHRPSHPQHIENWLNFLFILCAELGWDGRVRREY